MTRLSGPAAPYGVEFDDPEVTAAADVVANLPAPERQRVLTALTSAVCGYQRTHDPACLTDFARDFSATVRLRKDPDYEKALTEAPTTGRGRGRSIREIFEDAR